MMIISSGWHCRFDGASEKAIVRSKTAPSAFAGKPPEVGEHGRDQCLSPRILCSEGCAKKIEEIASLFRSLMPICGWGRQQVSLQFVLPQAQRLLVALDIGQQPPQLGRLLRDHPATLVEVYGLVGHDRILRRARGYSALSYNRRMSLLPYLCSSTSRNAPMRHSGGKSSIAKRMASAACANRLYPNGSRLGTRLRVGNSSAAAS